MDIRQYQGSSNYLKAADLQGRPVNVTIRAAVVEQIGQGRSQQEKVVLYFNGKEKGLVLNVTNGNSISKAYGFDTTNWVGCQIEIYPSETDYQGEMVDCLRVRVPAQIPAAATAPPAYVPPQGVPTAQTQRAMAADTTGEVPF